ncbi:competence protein ComK [Evansella sp. AB-rgal1]|uniref:competence protein ComK n=1 Tax=Evansella sp. AB-rgal1 TaxID=3242696 RepID=UPI00359D4F5B
MRKNIISNYYIYPFTLALVPVTNAAYYNVVYERDNTYFEKKTTIDLMLPSCEEDAPSIVSRPSAVAQRRRRNRKMLIPIYPISNLLLAFPTLSATNILCCWLFPEQI